MRALSARVHRRIAARSITCRTLPGFTETAMSLVAWAKASLLFPLMGVLLAGNAGAVGFALEQQSASNAGYAFAGTAAAEDATAMFWNPASLSFVRGRQAIL